MFSKLKNILGSNDNEPEKPTDQPPVLLGLRLGGSFTIDPMVLKTLEGELIIDGASPTQIIQAVGVVQIDQHNRVVRYYTDDEGYLQFLQYGDEDTGISEVGLWYYYDARPITDSNWRNALREEVVVESGVYQLEGHRFEQFWQDEAPVPMVEKTYHYDGKVTETTQFAMAYTRPISQEQVEMLLVSAEESVNKVHQTVERELVRSTGFGLNTIDITSN